MLADKQRFHVFEKELEKKGFLDKLQKENGPIRGRMMIDLVDLPEDLTFHFQEGRKVLAFEGTFDIYDMALGIALYTDPLEAASGLWMTPQTDAENPV